jgi:hypothetical protein
MFADLKDKQVEIIALMNSWVFSRMIAENERAGESLSHQVDAVAEAEREQGRSLLPSLLISCLPGMQALPFRVSHHFTTETRHYVYATSLMLIAVLFRTNACTAGELCVQHQGCSCHLE